MRRLLSYMKPYKLTVFCSSILVIFIIIVELYRPIIIGNAIDENILSYSSPYAIVQDGVGGGIPYDGILLRKVSAKERLAGNAYYQIFLSNDQYYMARSVSAEDSKPLADGDSTTIRKYLDSGAEKLSREELKVLRKKDFTELLWDSSFYLMLLLLGYLFNAANTWILQKMGQDIIYRLREDVFTHIHSLSLSFFNNTPVGKLVTRVTNDTETISELFTTVLVKLFKNSIKIVGYAVVMLSINVKMALVSFALLPIVGILTFTFRNFSRKAYQLTRNRITELNTFLSEHIYGMKLIQIFAKEQKKYQEFAEKSQQLYQANWREIMIFAIFRPIIYLISICATILVIGTGGFSVLSGTLSMGTLFIFITYITSFFEPIQELAEQFGTLQSAVASAEKVFSILDVEPEITNIAQPKRPVLNGKIEFRHVWFAYEKNDYILKDVSFVIQPGQTVAFVGATGAGKSTILNLIGRYFDIQKGQILIDGIDIHEIDTDTLRASIGQVQQDVFLFTGSIKTNISLGREDLTSEEIETAAKTVNADGFIQNLPLKYDEPVTERGSTLSAGQRQLLSFARTLAYQPSILVLDEATANIDTETEALITDAMNKLMKDRTTIMVAHRLSTIQHADLIIVMEHGQIAEIGPHQNLLKQNGVYRKLYDLQLATR